MKPTLGRTFPSPAFACVLAALLLLPGCKTAETPVPQNPPAPEVARQNTGLIGQPLSVAVRFYGPQISQDRTFRAGQAPSGVFYLPIRKRFPAGDPTAQATLIREVHWARGQMSMAVFCWRKNGEWQIFDSTEWVPAAGY